MLYEVITPAFQTDSFSGDVQITGDFSPSEASDLATIINYGALPVQLKRLTVQNVSPTLGQDQLDAGIAAGIIGLLLVSLYMLAFYRLLGLVVIAGISLSFVFIYALVVYLGSSIGLTLTLAGVTGLIVSVGVTVDSYVVYFERLKDEVRSGRTIRSAVDVGFTRSFKTVVAADLVSFRITSYNVCYTKLLRLRKTRTLAPNRPPENKVRRHRLTRPSRLRPRS